MEDDSHSHNLQTLVNAWIGYNWDSTSMPGQQTSKFKEYNSQRAKHADP